MGKISVIIPTYNSENFIGYVLQSIFVQTYSFYEIIIVDDGSEDDTIALIKRMNRNIRLIEQPHTGDPANGRNISVQEATEDFIAFLDHDDLWPNNKLAIQHQMLSVHNEADIVIGKTQIFRFAPKSYNLEKQFFGNLILICYYRRVLFTKSYLIKLVILMKNLNLGGAIVIGF